MAMDVSKIIGLRNSLQIASEESEALKYLNTLLTSSSNADILQICSIINPQQLFVFLNSDKSPEELDVVCAALSKMLLAYSAPEVARLSQYIELGLQHTYAGVRKMSLQLLQSKMEDESTTNMLTQPTMFHLVVQLLGDDCLDCAKHVNDIVVALFKRSSDIIAVGFLIEGLEMDLRALMLKNDIVRYRVFDMVVTLACINSDLFSLIDGLGFINLLLAELDSPDVLLKLNCLELLQVLMESPHGCDLLESTKTLNKLHEVLEHVEQDPLSSILMPGILKFFGHFCQYRPSSGLSVAVDCPLFLTFTLAQVHLPQDETVWGVAMDTVGLLGSTHQGRGILLIQQQETERAIKQLWEFVSKSKSDIRTRSLNILSSIFSCEVDTDFLSSDWFKLCPAPDPLSIVLKIVKQPFPELLCSGLRLILSISSWEWGQKQIQKSPGFVEFLLDRKSIADKDGKLLKYQIISNLANSLTAVVVFGSPLFMKFKEYERAGPFFVAEETSIAIEEI